MSALQGREVETRTFQHLKKCSMSKLCDAVHDCVCVRVCVRAAQVCPIIKHHQTVHLNKLSCTWWKAHVNKPQRLLLVWLGPYQRQSHSSAQRTTRLACVLHSLDVLFSFHTESTNLLLCFSSSLSGWFFFSEAVLRLSPVSHRLIGWTCARWSTSRAESPPFFSLTTENQQQQYQ